MKETIDGLAAQHPGPRFTPSDTRPRVDRWLDTADLNVTKAGWADLFGESSPSKYPWSSSVRPRGQEDRNSQALTTVGAALRARTLDQVVEAVDRILTRPALAESMREACRFLGRPNAGVDIATEVLRETAFHRTADDDSVPTGLPTGTE